MTHWPSQWPLSPDGPTAARHAMVVSADRHASDAGVEVLRAGGNAIDGAVAVALALAVVNPEAGNLGGGSFLVLRTAEGEVHALDFRGKAPAAATADMYLDERGDVTDRSVLGHLAIAVPGTVMGLWEVHRRFGTLSWRSLIEPAISLSRGFVVRPNFLRSFTPPVLEGLRRFPGSARIFLPGGAPPRVGSTLRQPELARTLELLQDQGPEGFYGGETAERIVAEVERGGGILTRDDLANYQVAWREPIRFDYRGHTLLSMPPSSSGGVTLAGSANILSRFTLGELPWHGPEHVHLLAEAWKRAYVDRNHYLADPDVVEMPLEVLASREYGAWRAREISLTAPAPSAAVEPAVEAYREWLRTRPAVLGGPARPPASGARPPRREGAHTTHLSVVDAQGNAVSLTTTLNTWYGSKVVAEGTGVLLNNEMDDFTSKPGVPNYFGLVQGVANAIAPGKRMLSAMSPTIVLDGEGRLSMVMGSPGGSTIITTVFQVLSNIVDHGMDLNRAVVAPRVHHQHLPDQIFHEPGGLPRPVVDALEALGHEVVERPDFSGDVQAVRILPDGTRQGQSDPRRGGAARGY